MAQLFVSAKDRVQKEVKSPGLDTAFRQVENWANRLVSYLGVVDSGPLKDVAIGEVVATFSGPSSNTNYPSGTTTIGTFTATLVTGHEYLVSLSNMVCQQITNAAAGNVQIFMQDSSTYIPNANGMKAFITAGLALNAFESGGTSMVIFPTATGTDTFTISAMTSANSLQVQANTVQAYVIRVK